MQLAGREKTGGVRKRTHPLSECGTQRAAFDGASKYSQESAIHVLRPKLSVDMCAGLADTVAGPPLLLRRQRRKMKG